MDASINKEALVNELQSVAYDYKATVIAAELLDNGLSADDIYFKNISQFKRFVSKDVESLSWDSNEDGNDRLVFEVNKEGLYDMLPEGITHSGSTKTSEKDALAQFNLHRKQERNAREFFGAFENEFMHRALQLEIIEREIFNNKNTSKNRDIFECFFGDSKFLTDSQVLTLLYILPLSNKIRGDINLISEILSKILDYKITVRDKTGLVKISDGNIHGAFLDQSFLGSDSIISDSYFTSTCQYEINIHDISRDDFRDFVVQGKNFNVLNFINPYFFPSDAYIIINLLSTENDKYLKTSFEEELFFLDFNSYI